MVAGMEWIPSAHMGRVASASLDPSGSFQKKTGDVQSMGSVASATAPPPWGERVPENLPWLAAQVGKVPSPVRSPQLRGKFTTTAREEGSFLDYMLTLLLQYSTRLRDLEAINYYTHVIQAQSNIYKCPEETYHCCFLTVSQNKEHNLGQPMIHRGKVLLDQVAAGEETPKGKEGLKAVWPVV